MTTPQATNPALEIYENLAAAAIRRHRGDARRLRRALTDVEAELFLASNDTVREGLKLVVQRLGDKLREMGA